MSELTERIQRRRRRVQFLEENGDSREVAETVAELEENFIDPLRQSNIRLEKENARLRDLLRIAIEELDDQDIPLPITLAEAREMFDE